MATEPQKSPQTIYRSLPSSSSTEQHDPGASDRADTAKGADPQAVARVGLGIGPRRFHRNQPRYCLARDDQPGHRRPDRWLHSAGRDRRCAGALRTACGSRASKFWLPRWTTPQRQWLQRIAAQTKANLIVDRDALDDPDLSFDGKAAASRGSIAFLTASWNRC